MKLRMKRRIEICGGIASGKTSLAKLLENEGFVAVYERFEDNPFLKSFYAKDGVDNTLETELVFALLHYNLIKNKSGNRDVVCDYSLFQDYCYGISNLKRVEMSVFQGLYDYLMEQVSSPALTIYLKCNVNCLLERIQHRNRGMEQSISKEYLQNNIDAIESQLAEVKDLLVIESDKYNFIEDDKDIIIERIMKRWRNMAKE